MPDHLIGSVKTGFLVVGMLLAGAGCEPTTKIDRITELQAQVRHLQEALDQKDDKISKQADTIAHQTERIETLLGLGPDRLEKLYYPTRIVIDPLTGGDDYDGKPGDDGITVYLKPVDRQGHVIKAAGDIFIQILDLTMPDGQKTVGEYALDVDHAREHWHGRFLTNHYTIKCPWQPGKEPPKNRELTVRVEFRDYLSGQKLTATTTCMISLPPADATVEK